MHEWCIDIKERLPLHFRSQMKILQYPVVWKIYSRQEKQKEFIIILKVYILKWESFENQVLNYIFSSVTLYIVCWFYFKNVYFGFYFKKFSYCSQDHLKCVHYFQPKNQWILENSFKIDKIFKSSFLCLYILYTKDFMVLIINIALHFCMFSQYKVRPLCSLHHLQFFL